MATTSERRNKIEKVEVVPGSRWAKVTVKNEDGQTSVIRVRKGSVFANRPRPRLTSR